ncbi:histidine kinase [Streptomyces sp. N2-109]|uniref:Histidine kinase n=1 Tax=Streptomyces gossypii TaxID=2883101 RepID=A0ABT2K0X3_9ACTN|nr:histidine kinase [Streptomyces gossypii]MCT2593269.1 histidine kinase [Streptomyces gossypii]
MRSADAISRLTGSVILGIGLFVGLAVGFYGKAIWFQNEPPLAHLLLALGGTPLFFYAYYRASWDAVRGSLGRCARPISLFTCGAMAIALAVLLGGYWVNLSIPFAGLISLSLTAKLAVPLNTALLTLCSAVLLAEGAALEEVASLAMGGTGVVFLYFSVGALGAAYRNVLDTCARVTSSAVLEERTRFARDLHDIFGHSLSVITLKSELAVRLLSNEQPERARSEVESVSDLSRRSISDIREVVRGYQMTTVAGEIEGLRAALETAGVRVTVSDTSRRTLPRHVQEAFAWMLREASTNILQHSAAENCTLTLWSDECRAWLRVTNDGARRESHGGGNGLAGLEERMGAVGGKLSCGFGPEDTYCVETAVPLYLSEARSA